MTQISILGCFSDLDNASLSIWLHEKNSPNLRICHLIFVKHRIVYETLNLFIFVTIST